jgi:hypothetical protein
MFLTLVDQDPLKAHVELASCLMVEAASGDSNQDQYMNEAWWHLEWALKIIKKEANPDPLALEAMDELLPVYQEMRSFIRAEAQESAARL